MKRSLTAVVVGLGVTLAATSCGKGAPAQPGSLEQSSSEAQKPDDAGAPKVDQPLAVDRYKQDPCALVSKETIAELGLDPKPQVENSSKGADGKTNKRCSWKPGAHDAAMLGVGLLGMGLDAQYKKQKTTHWFKYFKPTTVEGYPAIVVDAPHQGSTSMIVGLNDHESVSLETGSDATRDPDYATTIVNAAVKSLIKTARSGGK